MANLILWNIFNDDNSPIRTISSYQLASWLRQHGYTVKVIDFCQAMITEELVAITEKYIDFETIAIGVSSTFWRNIVEHRRPDGEPKWVVDARNAIMNKNIKWLLGGHGALDLTLKLDWIKFSGFSEDALLKWMDENSKKLMRRDLFDITTSTLMFSKDDYIRPYEVLPIELGRGCQFKCRFCAYELIGKKKGTYLKDYSLVREEFIRNYNEYGVTRYTILDDTVNESEEKVYALADIAQHLPFRLEWVGYNRLDLIWSRPGTIQALKDSGLRSTFFGIESFHPAASAAVGKGWMSKHGKEFLLKLKDEWKGDITWMLAFIVGLPGETRNDIENTHVWCADNKMYNWGFNHLWIDKNPGRKWKSEFETDYEKYGYSFIGNSSINWKNDLWTRPEAQIFADNLNKESFYSGKLAAFGLALYASLGYSFDELMGKDRPDLPWNEFRQRKISMVNEYVQSHLG